MEISCIIIEDELPNARRLEKLLGEQITPVTVISKIQTVKDAVLWLNGNKQPDLIFMDIRLTDGLSFDIYKQVNINSPVIFTTAYDEYALQAFKVNGMDYLLKPIEKEALERSIERVTRHFVKPNYNVLLDTLYRMQMQQKVYRSRFLVSSRDMFIPIGIEDIAYFGSEFKNTYFVTHKGEKHFVSQTMEELENELNPLSFFRITRQFIVCSQSIRSIHNYFNGRLKLALQPPVKEEIIVSREKALALKEWLNR
jgi:two-component system, LytTR family, response regulator LytT